MVRKGGVSGKVAITAVADLFIHELVAARTSLESGLYAFEWLPRRFGYYGSQLTSCVGTG